MSERGTALVTGASRGIGRACAVRLAREGFAVALTSRSEEDLAETARLCEAEGAEAMVLPADATDEQQLRDAVDRAAEGPGGLTSLVNNAGGTRFMAGLTDLRSDGWDKLIRLNLTQAFWALQQAGIHMVAGSGGTIVNMCSLAGEGSAPTLAAYGAAKAGLASLTRTAATEWGHAGVRVNAVAPGWIRTDLNRVMWENEQVRDQMVARAPLQRWGEAEEVAEAVAFFAGPAGSYVTGQTLLLDGGLSLASL